jgi:hypothetical protein
MTYATLTLCTSNSIQVYPWHHITGGTTLTAMANSMYANDTWDYWNTNTTATISTTTQWANQVWDDWCTHEYYNIGRVSVQVTQARVPTEEERLAARLRDAARQAERAEAEKVYVEKVKKARARAKSLLLEFLTPEQIEYMDRHGHIPVIGSRGRHYRVTTRNTASGNVSVVDDKGDVKGVFCVHPRLPHDGGSLPLEDSWLAQVLHLQSDEDEVLKVANLCSGANPLTAERALV